ncbi:hypothetical protein AM571_CH01442 [Rhizobium etli 8C-3]|uniref:Uncharacterized protein n=1 Tax=Rhizobium etli 8C-3 TaxID=538025 RepID=A0A1L5P2C0_RHIET|nr:hypothetical protein [Rhizobium etli]APO74277.1 hypothetical protein AM571_CH01442 [Rhizobium etli 8C-3]
MVRLKWGPDYEGVAALKITKNNADDPLTTPDSAVSKFHFNSKWDANVRFVGQDKQTYAGGNVTSWYPAGTNKNTFKRLKWGSDLGYNNVFWKGSYFQESGQLDYELPLFDLKPVTSDGWTIYCNIQKATGELDTKWYSYPMIYAGWAKGYLLDIGGDFPLDGVSFTALCAYCEGSTWGPGRSVQAIVYNLPGDDADILYPATTPVPGQKVVQITSDFCRVAKPGYAVTDIAAKLAFDSSNRPAKVIASGDIALPSGVVTTFDFSANLVGINVDSSSIVVDVIQYKGSTIVFPATIPDDEDDYGCPYRVNGQTIEFNNTGSACRARFIVIAQDDSPPTSGSNKVFRQVTIGGDPVFQFLRPGAASTPNLADVIIDSRWPCLQIIKTGVFSIPNSSGAAHNTDIAFTSAGLFPFVKYHTIHPAGPLPFSNSLGTVNSSASVQKIIRLPQVAAGFVRNGESGAKTSYISGETTVCELTTNRARFVTYRGGPYRKQYDDGIETISVRNPATQIRYYIFGIPA